LVYIHEKHIFVKAIYASIIEIWLHIVLSHIIMKDVCFV